MTTEPSNHTPPRDYSLPVVFLVVSVVVAISGLSVRIAGFLGVFDEIATMSGAFEAGRSQGALAAVLLGVAAGLAWVGFRGLVGASGRKLMCTSGAAVASISAGASLVSGLWLTSLGLAIAALALLVLGRGKSTS